MIHRVPAITALTAVMLLVSAANAGKFNKVLSIGDAMPGFSGLDAVTSEGKVFKLSSDDFKGKDAILIAITCNACPVANAYEDRIVEFTKRYAGKDSKLAFVAVNCNATDPKEDSEENFQKMVERAKEKAFTFPYAIDPSQKLGRALGARITPEFFVFDKNRKLVYMGVMDDSWTKPTENYLIPAVESVLKGEVPKIQETDIAGRGCGILYRNK
jgi:hypothetical protein